VEFYQGATKLGEAVTAPYRYSWTGVGAGTYVLTARATDNEGAVGVAKVGITVNTAATAPWIVAGPADTTVVVGQTAAFSVLAAGTAPLSYQWRKNGANIGGATATNYTTAATVLADNGAQFSVVVANGLGSVTSAPATVTVSVALYDTTDDHLGAITAQGENPPNEAMVKAFDNSTATKWLDFASANPSTRASWIQYAYTNGIAGRLAAYTITSANDHSERDPAAWQLLGSNDRGTNWILVDSQSGVVFSGRLQKQTFSLSGSPTYKAYRLNILRVATPASANCLQLSEIELLGAQVTVGGNHAPVAVAGNARTRVGRPVTVTLTATDADGDPLTYSLVGPVAAGSVSAPVSNRVTYTPPAAFVGTDSFGFRAFDGLTNSAPAVFTILVRPMPRIERFGSSGPTNRSLWWSEATNGVYVEMSPTLTPTAQWQVVVGPVDSVTNWVFTAPTNQVQGYYRIRVEE
jgi:hypothetical protein